jgi:hypothetical protein
MTDSAYAALEARLRELEARNREFEDIREINEVFYKWHYACTGGFNGKPAGRMEALECLTEDGTIEVQGMHEPGKGPRGREEYTKFWEYFYGDAGPLPYVFQTSVAEKVVVKGDTAVQESSMLVIAHSRGNKPVIGLSQRVNDFVRTPQGWRIKKTTIGGGLTVPVDEIHGDLNKLPPQEPRTMWTYGS